MNSVTPTNPSNPLNFGPLRIGDLVVDPPMVLAPMAGVTNAAFRVLCREQAQYPASGGFQAAPRPAATAESSEGARVAGLYVCEMVTSRGIVEGDQTTRSMLVFDSAEPIRSVQLYGVDPIHIGEATRILCAEYGVRHVDLNFGCPVPKVTRRGGGAALPWKRGLLADILRAAVTAAEPYGVPVTCKTRMGIDSDHLTYLEAGRIAEDSGCAAIALHGRTAAQHYSGTADWDAIAALVEHVRSIPVLGNGDVWEAGDAVRMMRQTGCAGVVIGRGCLGRPWLFRDLAAALTGQPRPELPALGEVARTVRRHAELLAGYDGEARACRELRKHMAWYFKGFAVGTRVRSALGLIDDLAGLDALLAELDPDEPFPAGELGTPRGRQGSPRTVVLPAGWLDDTDGSGASAPDLSGAELAVSGG